MWGLTTSCASASARRAWALTARSPNPRRSTDLGEEDLVRILTEPKNALVKQYRRIIGFEGAELEITPEALRAIAAEAIKHGTGARGLRSICERVLQDTMYTLPSEEGRVARVIVDEECVVSGAPATLEYAA